MKLLRISEFLRPDEEVEAWDIGRIAEHPRDLEAKYGLKFEPFSTPIGNGFLAASSTEGGMVLFKWLEIEDWDLGVVVELQSNAPQPSKAIAELRAFFGPDVFAADEDKLRNRIWEVWRTREGDEAVLVARTYAFHEAQSLALRLDEEVHGYHHDVRRAL
jgi:hypothetical protein